MDFENYIQNLLNEYQDNASWETDYKKATKDNNLDSMYDVGRYECLIEIINNIQRYDLNKNDINRVITVLLEPDDMEKVNVSTGIKPLTTENWCDYSTFVEVEESIECGDNTKINIKQFVSQEHLELLKNKLVDFIAFRLDC